MPADVAVRKTRSAAAYFKAATGTDAPEGTFDAIVAVFNNVDLGGDRLATTAFDKSLEEWRASGDPIPVIFSHQWDNLSAHVGEVDPKNVIALEPGDARLPAELMALGGLGVFGAQMDLEAEGEAGAFARNLWGKLKRRAIKEFSFAYEVPAGGARPTKDATELVKVGLIELGPTLKGMNPATALLDAKAAKKAIDGLDTYAALELLDELVPVPPTKAAGATIRVKRITAGRPDGAVEDLIDTIAACARLWATFKYGNELYYCHTEGTYLDARKTIITAERWIDPYGEGPLWELSYTLDDAGAIITDAKEVEATVTFTHVDLEGAKRRAKAHLDAGADRKMALWLTFLDDQGTEVIYGPDGEPTDVIGETSDPSTGFAARAAYAASQRGQARGATPAKGEEPSAANSPTGVLLEIEELELSTD